ncbi:MAG: ribosomal protein S18-alanine N-acetyltransferase [Pseudomonadota bacterium]
MVIKPLTLNDCERAAAVMQAAYQAPHVGAKPWSRDNLQSLLKSPSPGFGLVMNQPTPNAPIAGFLIARQIVDDAELLALAINPSNQRQGLAKKLLAALVNRLKQEHCDRVFLEVAAENHGAIGLYHTFGFTNTGRRKRYYKNQDALLMTLDIAD